MNVPHTHPWRVQFNQKVALEKARKLAELRQRRDQFAEDYKDPVYADARRATALLSYHNRKTKGVTTPATQGMK